MLAESTLLRPLVFVGEWLHALVAVCVACVVCVVCVVCVGRVGCVVGGRGSEPGLGLAALGREGDDCK